MDLDGNRKEEGAAGKSEGKPMRADGAPAAAAAPPPGVSRPAEGVGVGVGGGAAPSFPAAGPLRKPQCYHINGQSAQQHPVQFAVAAPDPAASLRQSREQPLHERAAAVVRSGRSHGHHRKPAAAGMISGRSSNRSEIGVGSQSGAMHVKTIRRLSASLDPAVQPARAWQGQARRSMAWRALPPAAAPPAAGYPLVNTAALAWTCPPPHPLAAAATPVRQYHPDAGPPLVDARRAGQSR